MGESRKEFLGWHGRNRISAKKWAPIRRAVLERDGYRCVQCGKAGRLEVDHIVPLHLGGAPYDMRNLQTLCRTPCHFAKSRRERMGDKAIHPDHAAWKDILAEL